MIGMKGLLKGWVEGKLKPYCREYQGADPSLPRDLARPVRVAVVGGGLAGLTAATFLAERGFQVTVFEKQGYFGGKVGAWQKELPLVGTQWIDHGFHAFFYQYYNLRRWMEKIGALQFLVPIPEYLIYGKEIHLSFKDLETTPVLNVLAMRSKGVFRYWDVALKPRMLELLELLRYSPERTFPRYDGVSFQDFADRLGIPKAMRRMFISFTRAFFADPGNMSTAELMKSFHFFYLSHDFGVNYEYLRGDCYHCFVKHAERFIREKGGALLSSREVSRIERKDSGYVIDGEVFPYLILAVDAPAVRRIIGSSPFLREEDPLWYSQLTGLKEAQGYAVYKVWIDKRLRKGYPPFFIVDRERVLDACTQFHDIDDGSAAWAQETGGGVFEWHCYALPPGLYGNEEKVKQLFLEEIVESFPELRGFRILAESFHMNRNFTAFHRGLYEGRPEVAGRLEDFLVAGDWVKLPVPAMLMEAAVTSALLAVNRVLKREGLSEETILTVPPRGALS